MTAQNNRTLKVSVVGTAGLPSSYGGFETLVENLSKYHFAEKLNTEFTVYCSSRHYKGIKQEKYLSTKLEYIDLNANGISSIAYDLRSILHAIRGGADVILVLGVSGALAFPLIRLISRAAIVVNIDGVEWKRQKWGRMARWYLHASEWMATKFASKTICDNEAISEYVRHSYGVEPITITYGGDHALTAQAEFTAFPLPAKFAFSVCRIEPENNVHLVLQAFAASPDYPLIFVGNWNNSKYARDLREQYASVKSLHLLDPIYDAGVLATLRSRCTLYAHGHSAGGTNPSLVEAMFFAKPVLAFDCSYNRVTTGDAAFYFRGAEELAAFVSDPASEATFFDIGQEMVRLAHERYMWRDIAKAYFSLISLVAPASAKLVPKGTTIDGKGATL